MRFFRGAFACAAIAAGCSSLEGLSGDYADDGGAEAGADSASTADASLPDSASGTDAGTDAEAGKGCKAISADFCIDFDDQVFPGVWKVTTNGAGSVGIDGTSSYSPSFSMVSATNGQDGGENGAAIKRPTGPLPDVVELEAQIRVDESDIKTNYDAIALYFTKPDSADFFLDLEISGTLDLYVQQLEYHPDGASFTSTREALGLAVKPGQWNHVRMTYTVATQKISVTISADGTPPQSAELPMRGAPYRNAGEVQFGDDRVQNGAIWRVRFDDVAMNVTP